MCDWKSGSLPRGHPLLGDLQQRADVAVELVLGAVVGVQRDVTGYFAATMCANSPSATAPVTMSLTAWPDRNSAPPVEIWMMPSLSASAKPRSAACSVWRT